MQNKKQKHIGDEVVQGVHHSDERAPAKVLVTWLAKEYPHHEKSKLWFIVAALILTGLVIYGLLTDGWTFSMALIVAAGAYYVSHRTPPEIVSMSITDRGIKIGRHSIDYQLIKFFWIAYDPPFVRRLYVRLQRKFTPDIAIEIDGVDVVEIRRALKKHITENEALEEPFSESLIRLFRL